MLLRLRLRVPAELVARFRTLPMGQKRFVAHVSDRIVRLGYEPPIAVLQDPSEPTRVVAITRPRVPYPQHVERVWGQKSLVIESVERVEDPQMRHRAASERGEAGDAIESSRSRRSEEYLQDDPGLLPSEIAAVRHALRNEHHPKHLRGFASTLDGWFPVAASLLLARVLVLEPGSTLRLREDRQSPRASDADIDRAREGLRAFAHRSGTPEEIVRTATKRAVCRLVDGEGLPSNTSLPSPIAFAAKTLMRPVGDYADGTVLRVVDANAARRVMPPTGREGFVSPTALQLALSMSKPEISMVSDRDEALSRGHRIEDATPPSDPRERRDTMLAQAMLDKARRTLERQRWIAWYAQQLPVTRFQFSEREES
jgi:hypothetical protein